MPEGLSSEDQEWWHGRQREMLEEQYMRDLAAAEGGGPGDPPTPHGPSLGEPMPDGLTEEEQVWWHGKQGELLREREIMLEHARRQQQGPGLGDLMPEGLTEEEEGWWHVRQEELRAEHNIMMAEGGGGGEV